MKNLDLKTIILARYPSLNNKPRIFKKVFFGFLEKILYINKINAFLERNGNYKGINFIDEIFEYLNFSFTVSNKDIKRIPSEGRLICVANHPVGSLDGLALIKLIYEIRQDVKIIANDILANITNIENFFLPYNIYSIAAQKNNVNEINNALEREEAVIIFPAAEVSRLKGITVTDSRWNKGAVFFAKKFHTPILPIKVIAKNSFLFYLVSVLHKNLSTMLLVHELFNKENKTIHIKIGDPIPAKAFSSSFIKDKMQIKLLKKHVYGLGRKKIYNTEKNIIHPVSRQLIKKELDNSDLLGKTSDEKNIIMTDYDLAPNVLTEIARLREVTFRRVGEGTGKKLDLDEYDKYYKHLVVWDDKALEIVGAYRIGLGKNIGRNYGYKGFYTSTLFKFSDKFINDFLPNSIELGRSFVQKKYWNTNALNYLWQGIGAFIAQNDDVKFLIGPVSISKTYPDNAVQNIVHYYKKWFTSTDILGEAKNKFTIPPVIHSELSEKYNLDDRKTEYNILKSSLKPFGFTVPVLYKHYSELCEDEGVSFIDFGVDADFENCVDGLILVDISKIKEEKKERFITPFRREKTFHYQY